MNISIGNSRWFRIVLKVLAILLALVLFAIWCANWEEGSLPVDGKLVNREALQAILDYCKYLENDECYSDDETNLSKSVFTNDRVVSKGRKCGIFFSYIHVDEDIDSIEGYEVTVSSWYNRVGILDAVWGFGRFGDCRTYMHISSEPLNMIFWVWPSEPGDGLLDVGLTELLETVGYDVPEI